MSAKTMTQRQQHLFDPGKVDDQGRDTDSAVNLMNDPLLIYDIIMMDDLGTPYRGEPGARY